MHVDAREDKGCKSKGTETEGRGIGEFSMLVGLPEPRVKATDIRTGKVIGHLRIIVVDISVGIMASNAGSVGVNLLFRYRSDVVMMVGHCVESC